MTSIGHDSSGAQLVGADRPANQPAAPDLLTDVARINHKLERYLEMWKQLPSLLAAASPPTAAAETEDHKIQAKPDVDRPAVDICVTDGFITVRVTNSAELTPGSERRAAGPGPL